MTSTRNSKGRTSGRYVLVFVAAAAVFSFLAAYFVLSLSRPAGSPLARMYRTEADLRALMTAVETYRTSLGVYPPAGAEGLRLATDYLSRSADYLPGGPPYDGWGRPYQYVPGDTYTVPGSQALRDDAGAYCAPDSYQLYSVGMDGDAGIENGSKRRDNVTSWDSSRPWRACYLELQRQFFAVHLDRATKKTTR